MALQQALKGEETKKKGEAVESLHSSYERLNSLFD